MNIARLLTEKRPGVRWHGGRIASALLYKHAFGAFGEGSVIVKPLILRGIERIYIGRNCQIYENVWLACEEGQGPVKIGDGTYLGHNVHIHAGSPIDIGRECMFADDVYIGSDDHARLNPQKGVTLTGSVSIGDRVFLGQRAIVLGGVTIGDGATIGAGAVVTRDIPAGAVAVGVPARILDKKRTAREILTKRELHQ